MKLSKLGTLLLLAAIVLTGCRSSSDVVSDRGIQKRKYRSGYFVSKRATTQVQKKGQSETDSEGPIEASQNRLAERTIAVESAADKTAVIAEVSSAAPVPRSSDPIHVEAQKAPEKIPAQIHGEQHSLPAPDHSKTYKAQPEFRKASTAKGEGLTYSKNTGRIGLILFLAGLIFYIIAIISLGSLTLGTSATAAGGAFAFAIVGWILMVVGIVMMTIHLLRLIVGA